MSLLTPTSAPVKVYKWDDVGAPLLNGSAGSMSDIFKACLVTGYGAKVGAGWTAPFESTTTKVLRPATGATTDFYLKLFGDTGTEMIAQVLTDMTSISTGNLKFQGQTPFKYGKRSPFNKWVLVATARYVWFFNESQTTKSGCYFFCGDLDPVVTGFDCVFMQHTSGSSNTGSAYNGLGVEQNGTGGTYGMALSQDKVTYHNFLSAFNGSLHLSSEPVGSYFYISLSRCLYTCPAVLSSAQGGILDNFSNVSFADNGQAYDAIAFGSGSTNNTVYILTK